MVATLGKSFTRVIRLRRKALDIRAYFISFLPRDALQRMCIARYTLRPGVRPSVSARLEAYIIIETAERIKAKFHYAIWSQTGPKLVADLQRAGIWPII